MREEAEPLLEQFLAGLRTAVPLTALWAHGSLALGDFRPDRSDVDTIAVVGAGITPGQRNALKALHRALAERFPMAEKLHCSYMAEGELDDPAVRHVTWAHQGLLTRPVTAVTRRELLAGGLTFTGPGPADLLPAVTDAELAAFVRADLRDFWLPATGRPVRWLQDIWVDLGMLTVARARVTLDDGRLITKGEALDVLTAMGAPPAVVADIRVRRYGTAALPRHRLRRAQQARTFTRTAIRTTLTT
jgi:hypothetical protein